MATAPEPEEIEAQAKRMTADGLAVDLASARQTIIRAAAAMIAREVADAHRRPERERADDAGDSAG